MEDNALELIAGLSTAEAPWTIGLVVGCSTTESATFTAAAHTAGVMDWLKLLSQTCFYHCKFQLQGFRDIFSVPKTQTLDSPFSFNNTFSFMSLPLPSFLGTSVSTLFLSRHVSSCHLFGIAVGSEYYIIHEQFLKVDFIKNCTITE